MRAGAEAGEPEGCPAIDDEADVPAATRAIEVLRRRLVAEAGRTVRPTSQRTLSPSS